MTLHAHTLSFSLIGALMLGACAVTSPYKQPDMPLPTAWKGSEQIAENNTENWWSRFRSAELTDLLQRVTGENTDLQASLQRIEQARAQTRIAGAGLYPSIGANASLSRSEGQGTSSSTAYQTNLSMSYELDLWQRQANTRDAAIYRLQAQTFDHEALSLVVAGDTALNYFQILTLKERIRLTEQNLRLFRDIANIVQTRMNEGAATGLEVAQQNTALANAEATLDQLRQQLTQTENAVALLAGTTPQQFNMGFNATLDQLTVPQIRPTQPSSLLQRRPDIRAAEETLKAAHADIAVARSAVFPTITLGVTPTLVASSLSNSPDFTLRLLAGLTQRIFEGGRIQGQIELAEAQQQELVQNYRRTVLTAFKETEDALADIKAAGARERNFNTAVNESQTAYRIARESYLSGATDFISLLDAQRNLLQAQDNYAQAKMARYTAAIALFKALGGGWYSQ